MIDLEHVSKEYKRGGPLALDDISLHVDDGEFVFLLGHSGAGKSTLLKLLLREELPSEGKVTVLGKDVARLRRHQVPYLRRQMGIIFQDFRLIPTMTVYENVAFAMRVTNIPTKKIKSRIPYVLSLVGLEDKMDRLPDELSGGEQQRVAVARALAHGPKLIIADEPTTALDSMNQREVVAQFHWIRERFGSSLILVSHDLGVVRQLAQEVLVMKDGVGVEYGGAELFSAPRHPYTRYLVDTRATLSKAFERVMRCR